MIEEAGEFYQIENKLGFKNYLYERNRTGSNKASSYVRAIDLLCEMIARCPVSFGEIKNLWSIPSPAQLEPRYEFLLQESRKGQNSVWAFEDLPISYLRDGFCSAAIKQYHFYLIELNFEKMILKAYREKTELDSFELESMEEVSVIPDYLLEDIEMPLGEDKLVFAKQRTNQSVFRNMIQRNYRGRCCITGLNIPAVNRASHIIGWAKDANKRLDPRNGLFLSATYDAAFDRHLISLDDDYRVILSTELHEFYSEDSFRSHFRAIEGQKIELPLEMEPRVNYLEAHRREGRF